MANPYQPQVPINTAQVRLLARQQWSPQSGVEAAQGQPYPDDIQNQLQDPQQFNLNLKGFVNPYSFTLYTYPVLTTTPTRIAPNNTRRCYLIIQNQGPGNLFLNFGQDVTYNSAAVTNVTNGMTLIETQIYEQIGGGGADINGNSYTNAFVSPDYISAMTDTAGTTVLLGEGIWRFTPDQGY